MARHARIISPLIPYFAVLTGMYILRNAWIAIGLYHAAMLTIVISTKSLKAKPGGSPLLYLSLLVFASGGAIFYFMWPYILPDSTLVMHKLTNYGITKAIWAYFAVYFCIINAIIEELFWRGRLGSDFINLQVNDVLFAGYHAMVLLAFTSFIWTLPVIVACTFAGWLWRVLYRATGKLTLPILTHVIADAGIIAAAHFRLFAQ